MALVPNIFLFMLHIQKVLEHILLSRSLDRPGLDRFFAKLNRLVNGSICRHDPLEIILSELNINGVDPTRYSFTSNIFKSFK